MRKKILMIVLVGLMVTLAFGTANASQVVYNNYSGWYNSAGYHQHSNENYTASGFVNGGYRNFFIFDLSGVSGTLTDATFNVYSYRTVVSVPGPYTIYATSLGASIADTQTSLAIYNGLTSGTAIGSITVDSSNNASWLSIVLNGAGLSWLQSKEGGIAVLGGSFTGSGRIFDSSYFTSGNNLTLTASSVPIPAAFWLLGSGLVGLVGMQKRLASKLG